MFTNYIQLFIFTTTKMTLYSRIYTFLYSEKLFNLHFTSTLYFRKISYKK